MNSASSRQSTRRTHADHQPQPSFGTISDPQGILRMARDHWVEVLRCPHCGKSGPANLSAEDKLSWNFQVDDIPEGFKVIRLDNDGRYFFCFCASCDEPVEP
jgi:hypothetical protein